MCPHCRAFITTKDRVCPYCEEKVGPRAAERRSGSILGGFVPHAHFVTVMILLINFSLYAATTLYSMRSGNEGALFNIDPQTLVRFGASYRPYNLAGQWWRLVTAGFLHGGIIHILMNSWVLFDLGAQVEEAFGTARFIVFYFAATVFGFVASTFWSGFSVGASAGLFGLIGAMIALGMMHRNAMGDAIKGMYVRWAVYGLLFGLLPGLRVDNAAHIGGLAAGFGVAWLARTPKLTVTLSEQVWRVLAGISLLLAMVSFLKMYLWLSAIAG